MGIGTPDEGDCFDVAAVLVEVGPQVIDDFFANLPAPGHRIPPTGAEILANIRQVMDQLAVAPPPSLPEPVKLTRAQMNVLPRAEPSPPWLGGQVAPLFGVSVVEVATVEESTPYLEGWLE